jgi:exosortase
MHIVDCLRPSLHLKMSLTDKPARSVNLTQSNHPQTQKSSPSRSFLFCFCGMWLYLIYHLSKEWLQNPQYGYGLFVPVFCLGIFWYRKDEWLSALYEKNSSTESRRSSLPFFLLISGFILLPLELFRQITPGSRLVGIFWALICFAFTLWIFRKLSSSSVPRVILGILILFATAIPWPTSFEVLMTQVLKRILSSLVADLLNFFGILAVARGNLIELGTGMINIDEACSGVRSLQSCIMASVALALFFRIGKRKSIVLVLLGVLFAVVGNLLRTLILSAIVAIRGPEVFEKVHDPAGWSILLCVTILLYLIAQYWGASVPLSSSSSSSKLIPWSRLPSMTALNWIGATSLLAAQGWFWIHDIDRKSMDQPFLELKKEVQPRLETVKIPDHLLGVLLPQKSGYYRGYTAEFGLISIYQFFWTTQADNLMAVYHRPDLCMVGSGWELQGEVQEMSIPLNGRMTQWYIFSFQQGDNHVFQAWSAWRDGIEQKMDFTGGGISPWAQMKQQLQLIREGRRTTNTEIVSVVLDAHFAKEQSLSEVIRYLFTIHHSEKI